MEWIRDIDHQCEAAGVKRYIKQLGSVWAKGNPDDEDRPSDIRGWRQAGQWPDSKGEDWSFWEDDLRVREYPPEIRGGDA